MSRFVQVTPTTEVEKTGWGWTVYGITHVRVLADGTILPMELFISLHRFRLMADRAAKRWLAGILNGTKEPPVILEVGNPSIRHQWRK